MIYYPLTRPQVSQEEVLAAGAVLPSEGCVLVRAVVNGQPCVRPSGTGTTEVFAGIAQTNTSMHVFAEATAVRVETITLNGAGFAELGQSPLAGTSYVWNETDGAAVLAAAFVITGSTITSAANAGKVITITYTHAQSVLQARARMGDVQPGGYAGYQTGTVSSIRRGVVYTNQFDTSVSWAITTPVSFGANGKLTTVSPTGEIPHGVVVALPSAEFPYLGIDFAA